jgi:hypothetical protein
MAPWFHNSRLDEQYSGSERSWLQFGFNYDFLVQQETGLRSPKHCRDRVHCWWYFWQKNSVAQEATFRLTQVWAHSYSLWQTELCKAHREPSVSCQIETHWNEISLHSEYWFRGKFSAFSMFRQQNRQQTFFTKPLPLIKFAYFRDKLGVAENASLAEREC